MFREYSYIHATPHNRASFVRLFWKCYRQIGKKGGICYFRFTLLYRFYFSWLRHHITVVSVFIFKPDKDRREIFILLLLILSKKNIFFFILYCTFLHILKWKSSVWLPIFDSNVLWRKDSFSVKYES